MLPSTSAVIITIMCSNSNSSYVYSRTFVIVDHDGMIVLVVLIDLQLERPSDPSVVRLWRHHRSMTAHSVVGAAG